MFKLPKIYPITDRRLSGMPVAAQCERLIEGGAEMIQIRQKRSPSDVFFEAAGEALKIAALSNVRIIINDRVDIAQFLKADGVHLGQDDLPPAKAREILGSRAIIGFSTHTVAQALDALRLPIDYIAIGPVFTTATKENPDASVGLEGVREVRRAIGKFPLVAIGGINYENYREVLAAGADSVAIISGLLADAGQIAKTFKNFNLD